MDLELGWYVLLEVLGIGMVAGVLGGLLGVGGSTIIIPGLTLVFGYHQHLYQAAAMVANVAVSVPAARRHWLAGAAEVRALRWILPMAVVFVMVGVWLSNCAFFQGAEGGLWLGRILAAFLVYVVVVNVKRLVDGSRGASRGNATVTASRSVAVGGVMGTIAGLLGIGGGAVAVPLQQVLLRLPLRTCIANSSAVICVSSAVGAVYKNASLGQHGYGWRESIVLALLLSPSCWLGGHLGAALTHSLPVWLVRVCFVVLMLGAAVKMAAVF